MSNALSAAAVTTTLSTRFTTLLNALGVAGLDVTIGHPRADADPGVYLHLVRVSPNTAFRNDDLPTRTADAGPMSRPTLAIDLHYALSFVGAEDTIDAERLLGIVLVDLHTRPVLTAEEVADAIAATAASNPVRGSDLARQREPVRVTMLPQNLEDHARLWGLFNQSFDALTVAIVAGPVLIDGDRPTALGLPVRELGAIVRAGQRPVIARAVNDDTDQPLVALGDALRIEGTSLASDRVRLRVGGVEELLAPDAVTPEALTWTVAGAALTPGPAAVTVEHLATLPDGSERVVFASAPAAVGIAPIPGAPVLAGVGDARTLTLPISPAPGTTQVVELLLSSAGALRSFRATSVGVGSAVFAVGSVAGTFGLRVVVDGVASMPAEQADGTWLLPSVVL